MNKVFSIILLVGLFSCNAPIQESTGIVVLSGATVYTGTGESISNATIVIRDGRIDCIGGCEVPDNAEVMDLTGKYITPGLVDAHVHFFQTGFFDSRPDAMDLREAFPTEKTYSYQGANPDRYYEAYLKSGVTAVYDVGGMPWSIQLQKTVEENLNAPHIAAAGTLITPAPEELISIFNNPTESVMVKLTDAETGKRVVRYNTGLGSTGIKVWGVEVGNEQFMSDLSEVAEEVKKSGNQLIVHSTPLDQAKAALRLGAKLLVHSVDDQAVDEEFLNLAKKNDVYYNPTIIVGRGYYNATKAVLGEEFDLQDPNNVLDEGTRSLLSNASDYAYMVDTVRQAANLDRRAKNLDQSDSIMYLNAMTLHENGIKLVVGTDAGNPGTLHGVSIFNEMEAMQNAGISAEDLIVIATKNGAEIMRRGDDFGTLELGKMADLVIMEKDPGKDIANMRSLTHVMRGGNIIKVK